MSFLDPVLRCETLENLSHKTILMKIVSSACSMFHVTMLMYVCKCQIYFTVFNVRKINIANTPLFDPINKMGPVTCSGFSLCLSVLDVTVISQHQMVLQQHIILLKTSNF